jgi:hypothetical protein
LNAWETLSLAAATTCELPPLGKGATKLVSETLSVSRASQICLDCRNGDAGTGPANKFR